MPGMFVGRGMGGLMSSGAAASWWVVPGKTCVRAYQPKGAASLAASYINLANPGTGNAAPGTAPTLDADGWVFVAASSQYLLTGITHDSNYALIVRFSGGNTTSGNHMMIGATSGGSTRLMLSNYYPAAADGNLYGFGAFKTSTKRTSGVMAVSAGYGYYNGSVDTTEMAWSGTNTRETVIGAVNSSGTMSEFFDGKIQAAAIYSTPLTSAEIAALTLRMAAL